MQPYLSCNRCRGLRAGWGGYILHRVIGQEWISTSSKLLILTVVFASFIFGSSKSGSPGLPAEGSVRPTSEAPFEGPLARVIDPSVNLIEAFLQRNQVNPVRRTRVAESIVSSAKKYDVDPKLVASIMIIESRANPFAISTKDAIGIMQIHLPTWGPVAHREGINLFRIEENVDFGTRILKDYVAHFGVWQGVRRYKGWNAEDPASERSVDEYLAKVQRVYGIEPAEPAETDLLE